MSDCTITAPPFDRKRDTWSTCSYPPSRYRTVVPGTVLASNCTRLSVVVLVTTTTGTSYLVVLLAYTQYLVEYHVATVLQTTLSTVDYSLSIDLVVSIRYFNLNNNNEL